MNKSPKTAFFMHNLGNKSYLQIFHQPTYIKIHAPLMTVGNNMNKTQNDFFLLAISHHFSYKDRPAFQHKATLAVLGTVCKFRM